MPRRSSVYAYRPTATDAHASCQRRRRTLHDFLSPSQCSHLRDSPLTFMSTLAVPAISQAATAVTYTGTVRIDDTNDGRNDPIAEPLSVTVDRHHVTDYSFFATLRCSDGSFMNVGLNYVQLSRAPIPLRGNTLSISVGNATQGDGLTATITGRLAGKHMSGSLQAQAHEFSGVAPSGPVCSSSYPWKAVSQRAAQAPKPLKAKPSVSMTIDPVRLPTSASTYSYGIAVANVTCAGGANAFKVSVAGKSSTLSCASAVRRPITKAVMGLSAGRSYEVHVQAIKRRGKRRSYGVSRHVTVRIPTSGSPGWHVISGL
jgi:hypothetical protein